MKTTPGLCAEGSGKAKGVEGGPLSVCLLSPGINRVTHSSNTGSSILNSVQALGDIGELRTEE